MNNIDDFWLADGNLYYKIKNNFFCNTNKILLSPDAVINSKFEKIFLYDDSSLYELNSLLKKKEVFHSYNSSNIEYVGNDYYRVFKRENNDLFKNELYLNEILKWRFTEDNWIKNPTHLFLFSKKFDFSRIFSRDIHTGDTLWHFSVSELGRWIDMGEEREGKIIGPIVECNGVLIMGVSGNRIIGLEKNTGKLLWNNQYPPSGSGYLVYKESAYSLHQHFCKLNPKTGEETVLFPYYPVFDEQHADAYCIDIITDNYYISVGRLDCVILKWDILTGQIVWRHEIYPPKKTGRRGITLKGDILDPVQYHQGKLYILTSDKILHVFDVR